MSRRLQGSLIVLVDQRYVRTERQYFPAHFNPPIVCREVERSLHLAFRPVVDLEVGAKMGKHLRPSIDSAEHKERAALV